jgi:hypothetical protein
MNIEEYRRLNEKREAQRRAKQQKAPSLWKSWWSTPADRTALIGALSTFALAFLALLQLYVLRGQLTAMEDDQRPWVYATNPLTMITPLYFDENGGHLLLQFTIKNVGKTPARFARLDGHMFSRDKMFYPTIAWANCEKRSQTPTKSLIDGIAVFPNDQVVQRHLWEMSTKDIETLKTKKAFTTMLSVCVDYIGGDGQHHQSRSLYELNKRGKNGESLYVDPQEGNVAAGDLYFNSNPDVNGDAF